MLLLALLQTEGASFTQPRYFFPVIVSLFVIGAVASLIASVLGFARARAYGASMRWFALAAVCLLLFHIQFLLFGFGVALKEDQIAFTVLTFFNTFVVLAAVCAIMGFVRLTSPRSPLPGPPPYQSSSSD